ncbi:hypothetical protein TREMEDRAFT_24787, partial [Tremella mesenterica DSM 1558]|uniref:uncharacterized protein n=1 Tax=Tremella mesenterica (strain ATCC 24925 / CBS 8224 / DSM 1558 / NBRC 9311 / NRRL Y-6157 / RJB 2259-6 / UBC 559-6) TaxID=578456 RepID=UPI0003F4A1FC
DNTNPKWWKDRGLRLNVLYWCVTFVTWNTLLGYSLLTGLQAVPSWGVYFNHPSGNMLGLITASIFLPAIIFCFVGGYLGNLIGRRPTILIGNVFMVAGALLNALAKNRGQFSGGRVLIGIGGSMIKVVAPALNQELAHPRLRPVLGAMYYGFYYTGSTMSSWLCVAGLYIDRGGEWGWRFPCLFQIVGPIVIASITLASPESPRYYIKKGNPERALQVLARLHANGDMDDELIHYEVREIRTAIDAENEGANTSYKDFFRTPGNRRRLICAITLGLGTNWVGNGLVSYYLSPVLKSVGIKSPLQITCINAGLAMWNLVLAWGGAWAVERFGRRPLFFISTWGMFFSYAVVMGLSAGFAQTASSRMGTAVIPFLFFFYGFYDIAWTPLPYHYTTEIMPYGLRTKGLAIFTMFNQLGNAFNQFANPVALKAIAWKYYAVYLALLIVFFVLEYLFFPETKGLSLEEITQVFDYGVKGRKAAIEDVKAHIVEEKGHDAGSLRKEDIQHVEERPTV